MFTKPYAVTVMDNWTPMRTFWTLKAARKFASRHKGYSYIYCMGWVLKE